MFIHFSFKVTGDKKIIFPYLNKMEIVYNKKKIINAHTFSIIIVKIQNSIVIIKNIKRELK